MGTQYKCSSCNICNCAERIFYTLFNGFGTPNTSPVASDLFYETEDAFVHIDIKTVTTTNRGDMTDKISVGENQHSYYGRILVMVVIIKENYHVYILNQMVVKKHA